MARGTAAGAAAGYEQAGSSSLYPATRVGSFTALPYLFLCLTVLFGVASAAGAAVFVQCDFVHYGFSSYGSWTTSSGYTEDEFFAFEAMVLCLALAVLCGTLYLYSSVSAEKKAQYGVRDPRQLSIVETPAFILGERVVVFITLCVLAEVARRSYVHGVLNCWVFCIGASAGSGNQPDSGFIPVVGMTYYFTCLIFACPCAILIAKSGIAMRGTRRLTTRGEAVGIPIDGPAGAGAGAELELDDGTAAYGRPADSSRSADSIKATVTGRAAAAAASAASGPESGAGGDSAGMGSSLVSTPAANESDFEAMPLLHAVSKPGLQPHHGESVATAAARERAQRMRQGRLVQRSRKPFASHDRVDAIVTALVLVLLVPFFFIASSLLPDQWYSFDRSKLAAYAAETLTDSAAVLNIRFSADANLKFTPDMLMYFLFLYVIAAAGLSAAGFPNLRRALHLRPQRLRGFSVGEAGTIGALLALGISLFVYYMFFHSWDWTYVDSRTVPERLARSSGRLTNIVLGLLIIPATRNSALPALLGVSWDHTVQFHRWLGYTMLIMVAVHMFSWWLVFAEDGNFPHDIFSTHLKTYPDDFTVMLILIACILMWICMGVFAWESMRRWNYELFYYSHHVYLLIIGSVLWHAAASWYYVIPSLCLWLVDKLFRFCKSACDVEVVHSAVLPGRVAQIDFLVQGGGNNPFGRNLEPMVHGMGQYLFLHVPEVSAMEWHPFTLSSSPVDSVSTLHIKGMGEGTFSQRLADHIATLSDDDKLMCSVDGPYGIPLSFMEYERIVFVAGGIGVTPMNSCLRALHWLAQHNMLPQTLEHIRLIWVSRDRQLFDAFSDTLNGIMLDNVGGAFSVSLHYTGAPEPLSAANARGAGTEHPAQSGAALSRAVEPGRPDLSREIAVLSPYGQKALVFVCGPEALKQNCLEVCMDCKVDFRSETFEM